MLLKIYLRFWLYSHVFVLFYVLFFYIFCFFSVSIFLFFVMLSKINLFAFINVFRYVYFLHFWFFVLIIKFLIQFNFYIKILCWRFVLLMFAEHFKECMKHDKVGIYAVILLLSIMLRPVPGIKVTKNTLFILSKCKKPFT